MASSAFLVFKIFRGRTPGTPFQKCVVILQSNTAQHKAGWKSEYATQGVNTHKSGATCLICELLAKDLLYHLSVKYRAVKDQDPVKMQKN